MPDDEHASVWTIARELPPFGSGDDEDVTVLTRRLWIGRVDQRLRVRPQERHQLLELPSLGDFYQCLGGLLRRGKRSRPWAGRTARERCADRTHAHESDRATGTGQQTRTHRRLPPLRELLRLLWPRALAARSDLPLE